MCDIIGLELAYSIVPLIKFAGANVTAIHAFRARIISRKRRLLFIIAVASPHFSMKGWLYRSAIMFCGTAYQYFWQLTLRMQSPVYYDPIMSTTSEDEARGIWLRSRSCGITRGRSRGWSREKKNQRNLCEDRNRKLKIVRSRGDRRGQALPWISECLNIE